MLKRPTTERLNRVTLGNTTGPNGYIHGDFGGPIDSAGTFGYRVNVLGQDGDTATDAQSIERQFVSAAFDWHLSGKFLLQLDTSYSHYRIEGTEPYWATTAGVLFPDAPDADTYYGQPYSFTETNQRHIGTGFIWDISDVFTLRTKYAHRESDIELLAVNNTFVAGLGERTNRNRLQGPRSRHSLHRCPVPNRQGSPIHRRQRPDPPRLHAGRSLGSPRL